jgi:hypothetical protein
VNFDFTSKQSTRTASGGQPPLVEPAENGLHLPLVVNDVRHLTHKPPFLESLS